MPTKDYTSSESARRRAALSPAILLSSRAKATFVHYPHETLVIAESAHPCGGCGAMHFIFINRGGPTLCVGCTIKDSASSGRRGARND